MKASFCALEDAASSTSTAVMGTMTAATLVMRGGVFVYILTNFGHHEYSLY